MPSAPPRMSLGRISIRGLRPPIPPRFYSFDSLDPAYWPDLSFLPFLGASADFLSALFFFLSDLSVVSAGWLRGKVTMMAVPSPGSLSTVRVARWYSALCLTMDRPRPVPPVSLERLLSVR